MPYRKPYKGYLDDVQEVSNQLIKIKGNLVGEESKEAEAIRGVIKQITKLNEALRDLFDRLEPANKYYGQEGEIKE